MSHGRHKKKEGRYTVRRNRKITELYSVTFCGDFSVIFPYEKNGRCRVLPELGKTVFKEVL